MTNELTQDAEESRAIEKTAVEQTELTNTAAVATAPETFAAAVAADAPEVIAEAPKTVAVAPETASDAPSEAIEAPATVEVEAPVIAETIEAPVTAETVEAPATVESVDATAEKAVEPTVEAERPVETAPAVEAAPAKKDIPDDTLLSGEIDFGAILEQFEQEQTVFHQGELVEGKVVGITDRGVLIDFGYKSEGFVPPEEFTGPDGQMMATVGDTVEVTIRAMHAGDGAPQLSRIDALGRKVWDEIEAAFNSETPITGRVVDKTKGGLRIDLNGIEAFLPGSQIDSRPIRSLDSYIGQDIEAKIIKFSRRRNNIVMSRKVITDLVVNEQKAETMAKVDVGHIVDGTIKNLTEYGAFVDIGGIDGLLHVTDMSWGRIHNPADHFKAGDHLQVKVLKLDREKEKISLGYKQLLPDPWSTVVEVYPVNSKIKGIVSSVTEYGVFVEIEAGVEGLVHVSEISWSRRSQSPKRMFHKGQEVEVQVLGVDTVEKRISLGMKQFQENPWDMVDVKYPVGAKIIGRVRNLTDFGAFIELEEGIDGLVHVSDISWAKKIKHPKDVLKKDQEVEAIVTSIDKRGQRLSLSMKDLTPSAWEGFTATHRPGDVVRGKVSRFTNFGVFVEIGEGLEGLCHISELSDERVENPESVATLGQEMDFKILRIEPVEQKIGLSHRAVGKENEPIVDSRMYSTEAKGGMASLGELAKLRFGDAEAEKPVEQDPEEKKRAKLAAKEAKTKEFAAKEAAAAEAAKAEAEPEAAEEPAATEDAPAAELAASTEEAPIAETTDDADDAAVAETTEETPAAEPTDEEAATTETTESVAEEVPTAETAHDQATSTEVESAEPVNETVAEPVTESVEPLAEVTELVVEAEAAEKAVTAETEAGEKEAESEKKSA